MPRVAFSAALGLPRSEPGTVPFDKVLLNDGGYYDPETGNREDRQGAQLRTWVRPPSCLYRQVQLSICNCKDLYPLHALTTQLRQGESGEGRDIHTTSSLAPTPAQALQQLLEMQQGIPTVSSLVDYQGKGRWATHN